VEVWGGLLVPADSAEKGTPQGRWRHPWMPYFHDAYAPGRNYPYTRHLIYPPSQARFAYALGPQTGYNVSSMNIRSVGMIVVMCLGLGCAAMQVRDDLPPGAPKGWVEFYILAADHGPDARAEIIDERQVSLGQTGFDGGASERTGLRLASTPGRRAFTVEVSNARETVGVDVVEGKTSPVWIHFSNTVGNARYTSFHMEVFVQPARLDEVPTTQSSGAGTTAMEVPVGPGSARVQAIAPARLAVCDGMPCADSAMVGVQPGSHSFFVGLTGEPSSLEKPISAVLHSGGTYRIGISTTDDKNQDWHPFVEDQSNGELIAAPIIVGGVVAIAIALGEVNVEVSLAPPLAPVLTHVGLAFHGHLGRESGKLVTTPLTVVGRDGRVLFPVFPAKMEVTSLAPEAGTPTLTFPSNAVAYREQIIPGSMIELKAITYVSEQKGQKGFTAVGFQGVARGPIVVRESGNVVKTIPDGSKVVIFCGHLQ
jgi:hypothetical protein